MGAAAGFPPHGPAHRFPPQDACTKALYEELLAGMGGVSFVTDDARTMPFRLAGLLFQHPWLIDRLFAHVARLVLTGTIPPGLCATC